MKPTLEELEGIVRNRICSVCSHRTVEGVCGDAQPERCPLFALFPQVAQAILATDSDDIQPFINAIHENVCAVCIDQRLDGTCQLREDRTCALDSCLPQVVDAIQEALGRPFRPGRTAPVR